MRADVLPEMRIVRRSLNEVIVASKEGNFNTNAHFKTLLETLKEDCKRLSAFVKQCGTEAVDASRTVKAWEVRATLIHETYNRVCCKSFLPFLNHTG